MIVRFLKNREIKYKYKNIEVNKNLRWGVKEGYDYVVISIDVANSKVSEVQEPIRYWIINDDENILPYDAYNFEIIDSYFPKSWSMKLQSGGIDLSHPKWAQYGYIEDYCDDIKVTREYNKIAKEIFYESIEAAEKNGLKLNLGIKDIWKVRQSD